MLFLFSSFSLVVFCVALSPTSVCVFVYFNLSVSCSHSLVFLLLLTVSHFICSAYSLLLSVCLSLSVFLCLCLCLSLIFYLSSLFLSFSMSPSLFLALSHSVIFQFTLCLSVSLPLIASLPDSFSQILSPRLSLPYSFSQTLSPNPKGISRELFFAATA